MWPDISSHVTCRIVLLNDQGRSKEDNQHVLAFQNGFESTFFFLITVQKNFI